MLAMVSSGVAVGATAVGKAKEGVSTAVRASEDLLRRRRVAALTAEQRASVRALFDKADTLRRDRIDRVELREALRTLTDTWLSDTELEALWAEIARNGRGADTSDGSDTIGYAEFELEIGPQMFPPKSVVMLRTIAQRAVETSKPLTDHARDKVTAAATGLTEAVLAKVLDAVRTTVTENGIDPDMPKPLRKAVAYALGGVMTDVEAEVRDKVLGMLSPHAPRRGPPAARNPILGLLHGARAFVLHTLRPHDHTLWVQIRNPAWWLLKLLSIFPLYGVQPCFFLLTFAMIDKSDEFQLVEFILMFKGECRSGRLPDPNPNPTRGVETHVQGRMPQWARCITWLLDCMPIRIHATDCLMAYPSASVNV
jgi:hypothetical protein